MSTDPSFPSPPTVCLYPPIIPPNGTSAWSSSGRSISFALSPIGTELSAFVTPKAYTTGVIKDAQGNVGKEEVPKKVEGVFEQDRAVYSAKWANVAPSLHKLYTDSHLIFGALQTIYKSHTTLLHTHRLQRSQSTHQSSLGYTYSTDPYSSDFLTPKLSFKDDITPIPGGYVYPGEGGYSYGYERTDGYGNVLRPGSEQVKYYRRIGDDYGLRLGEVVKDPKTDTATRTHFIPLYATHQLATTLHIPSDGLGISLLGEELLDWYNAFQDPNGGGELERLALEVNLREKVWEGEGFEEVIVKSILRGFLSTMTHPLLKNLDRHPQPSITAFNDILLNAIQSFPRSFDTKKYPTEHAFITARTKWRNTLKAKISAFKQGKETPDGHGWLAFELEHEQEHGESLAPVKEKNEEEKKLRELEREWERFFNTIVDVLTGVKERIVEECDDWRELVAVWGVLIEPGIKRSDMTEVMKSIWKMKAPDLTVPEEKVQNYLLEGDVTKALAECFKIDLWLAAHLTDLLDKMGLVEDDETFFELPLRDYFILSYTDHLLSNSSYWNLACSYLATCGKPGEGRIRVIVKHHGLVTGTKGDDAQGMDIEEGSTVLVNGVKPETGKNKWDLEAVHDALKVCIANDLLLEHSEICRATAMRLLKGGEYGIAVSYSVQSGDEHQLGMIADAILDVYVTEGAKAYIEAVDSIAPSLFLVSEPSKPGLTDGGMDQDEIIPDGLLPTTRPKLAFLSKFRDFVLAIQQGEKGIAAELLVAMFRTGLVPKRFAVILLLDSQQLLQSEETLFRSTDIFELMHHMEEVISGSTYSPELYLADLYRLQGKVTPKPLKNGSIDISQRMMKSRKEQEISRQQDIVGMKDALKALDGFKLAASRCLSRTAMTLEDDW